MHAALCYCSIYAAMCNSAVTACSCFAADYGLVLMLCSWLPSRAHALLLATVACSCFAPGYRRVLCTSWCGTLCGLALCVILNASLYMTLNYLNFSTCLSMWRSYVTLASDVGSVWRGVMMAFACSAQRGLHASLHDMLEFSPLLLKYNCRTMSSRARTPLSYQYDHEQCAYEQQLGEAVVMG